MFGNRIRPFLMTTSWSIWFVADRSHKTLPVPRTKGLSGGFAIVTADNNKYFHLLCHHLELLGNICKKEDIQMCLF